MKVPALGHLRDIVKLNRQAINDLNLLDRRLTVSDAVRSYHIAQGTEAEQTMTLHNGVDLEQFRPRHTAPDSYIASCNCPNPLD